MRRHSPVQYIHKTKVFYESQGFERPYEWARNDETPFCTVRKPLSASTVTTITTGASYRREESDIRFIESIPINPIPSRLYADDLAWDKKATHMDDVGSYLPLRALRDKQTGGRIGELATRFHCVPTEYSQRRTREHDAPKILELCREDKADLAILVPL